MIDYKKWRQSKLFGISGCFRLRNETQFMEAAILSHLPYLDEAVLIVQPSDDDTVKKAHRLAEQYDKIKVFEYPYIIDWIDTPGFYEKDPNAPGHLVHLSNYALSVCSYSWIAKTEGDVICLSSFERVVDAVKQDPEKHHYYGRVILNVAGENYDKISVINPRNGGWDEAVFNNDPDLWSFVRRGKWETIPLNGPHTCLGWSALHMKRSKVENIDWNDEKYVQFDRGSVRQALVGFNKTHPYPAHDDPLGEDCLYEKDWL